MPDNVSSEYRGAIARVGKLYQAYKKAGGSFLNHGPAWSPTYWESVATVTTPSLFIWQDSWGEHKITRALIQKLWVEAQSELDAARALTFTMIWGFGTVRYGRTNLTKILSFKGGDIEEMGLYLLEKYALAQSKPLVVYEDFLRGGPKALGPVYASKLLYAMTPLESRTPVIDRWVSDWFRKRWQIEMRPAERRQVDANLQTLQRLGDFCRAALDVLEKSEVLVHPRDVGMIEYFIFWDAQPTSRRRLAPKWLEFVP